MKGAVGFDPGSLTEVKVLSVSPCHFLPLQLASCVSVGRLISFSEPQLIIRKTEQQGIKSLKDELTHNLCGVPSNC